MDEDASVLGLPRAGRTRGRLLLAGRLGTVGGALGVLAGLVQAGMGARIPQWGGDKADPVVLGLLTVALSAGAVLGARALNSAGAVSAQRRLLVVVAFVLPGALCWSTAGRLWWGPGVLLLLATAAAAGAGGPARLGTVLWRHWLQALLSVLAAGQLLMAASAGPPLSVVVGVTGGLAVLATWAPMSRRATVLIVVVATVPFAVLTWTSLVTPLLAGLAVAIAVAVGRSRSRLHESSWLCSHHYVWRMVDGRGRLRTVRAGPHSHSRRPSSPVPATKVPMTAAGGPVGSFVSRLIRGSTHTLGSFRHSPNGRYRTRVNP